MTSFFKNPCQSDGRYGFTISCKNRSFCRLFTAAISDVDVDLIWLLFFSCKWLSLSSKVFYNFLIDLQWGRPHTNPKDDWVFKVIFSLLPNVNFPSQDPLMNENSYQNIAKSLS
jgi:hypothetical protein